MSQVRTNVVDLPEGGGKLALIILDDEGSGSPFTFHPQSLAQLREAIQDATQQAANGLISAIAVTGSGRTFCAGADLKFVPEIQNRDEALALARTGHETFDLLARTGIPTFAFINGAALGGGLELALHCDYRVAASDVRSLGLPETHLGLVPGWGGCWLLPQLIGPERALLVIVRNPLDNNRLLDATGAADLGIVDAVLTSAHPGTTPPPGEDFLAQATAWAAGVVRHEIEVTRPAVDRSAETWATAVAKTREVVDARRHGAVPAPYYALDLIAQAATNTREAGFAAEDHALADLLISPQVRATLYALDLVRAYGPTSHRAAAATTAGTPINRVGIVGAGLMASQLAVLVAQRLQVPVVMRDLDQTRVANGLAAAHAQINRSVQRGRLTEDQGLATNALITGTIDIADLAGCNLVIEAVTEKLSIKKEVFAEVAKVVGPTAVLATNTSALSVADIASAVDEPHRVVGLHFFNPVAAMPLVEVVRAPQTDAETINTAMAVVGKLGKTAVQVADAPGFVVNRLLLRFLSELLAAADSGVPVTTVDAAVQPLALPMGPFALLQLVGPAVAAHVLETLHENFPDRFPRSPGLARIVADDLPLLTAGSEGTDGELAPELQGAFTGSADAPDGQEQILDRVLRALAQEVALLLDDEVVATAEEVDLCMLLGAGWPLHVGGLTPLLDRTGIAEEVAGKPFHGERFAQAAA